MANKRKYFGTVQLKKAYIGEKSVNQVIEPKEAVKLARLILQAAETDNESDLATHFARKRRDGKINMTITQKK